MSLQTNPLLIIELALLGVLLCIWIGVRIKNRVTEFQPLDKDFRKKRKVKKSHDGTIDYFPVLDYSNKE